MNNRTNPMGLEDSSKSACYRIRDLIINVGSRRVVRNGEPLKIGGLTFDFLRVLAESAPNIASYDELAETVWQGRSATPETIAQRAKLLRDALSDEAAAPRYFEPVRGQGYRLCCAVEPVSAPETVSQAPAAYPRRRPLVSALAALAAIAMLLIGGWRLFGSYREMPSVAVLSFKDLSERGDQAYIVRGLEEELINALWSLDGLVVLDGTSYVTDPGSSDYQRAIGQELNVTFVLYGSIRRSADGLRLTAFLIDVATGTVLCCGNFDHRELEDVLVLQDELSAAVADEFVATLGLSSPDLRYLGTESSEAFDAFLKGRELWIANPAAAVDAFQRAIEFDPGYPLPWAWISQSYGILAQRATDAEDEERQFGLMMRAASKSVDLGPDYWESYNALTWARLGEHDWIGANEAFEQSADLVRSSGGRMVFQHATYVETLGRMDETIERLKNLLLRDPLNEEALSFLYNAVGVQGPLEDFVAEARLRGLTYEDAACEAYSSASYIKRGDADLVQACMSRAPDGSIYKRLSEVIGSREATLEFIRNELASKAFIDRADLSQLMLVAGGYGDPELAIQVLREAYLRKSWGGYFLIWHEALSEMRQTPEFKEFMVEFGLIDLFRSTNKWNDYCRPVGTDDFECR